MDENAHLLPVGEVARRAGLTTKALRHYDAVGLLVPHLVSTDGHRWYRPEQVQAARLIARLRAVDVPLAAVRAFLNGTADDDLRHLLTRHRAALQARDDRLRRSLHALDHLIADHREITMALAHEPAEIPADERALAARLFNDTWTLLEQEERTAQDEDRMLHSAHASRFHWDNVGTDQHRAIGEWQCSRVYAVLGRGEPALHHARRSITYAASPGVESWVAASAEEALARALAVAGDLDAAQDARDQALALAGTITDEEDRAVVLADIDTLPLR